MRRPRPNAAGGGAVCPPPPAGCRAKWHYKAAVRIGGDNVGGTSPSATCALHKLSRGQKGGRHGCVHGGTAESAVPGAVLKYREVAPDDAGDPVSGVHHAKEAEGSAAAFSFRLLGVGVLRESVASAGDGGTGAV